MNSGKYTVDRFEGEEAVLLDRKNESIQLVKNKASLPEGIKEGDILFLECNDEGKMVSSEILQEETERARQTAKERIKKLNNKRELS